jgi:hypothetical protein
MPRVTTKYALRLNTYRHLSDRQQNKATRLQKRVDKALHKSDRYESKASGEFSKLFDKYYAQQSA